MADEARKHYRIQLFQKTEVMTEAFDYPDVTDEKDALSRAQKFIDGEKQLKKGTYRLEAVEVKETLPVDLEPTTPSN